MFHSTQAPQHPAVPWVVWSSLVFGIIILQVFAAGGFPEGSDKSTPPAPLLILTFAGFFISVIIRWTVIPRIDNYQPMLTAMMIGMALAEGTGIFGMFVISSDFPDTKIVAFVCALLGIIQFAPTYFPKEQTPKS